MHAVKNHLEIRSTKQPSKRVKVKQALHQGCVLVDSINDLHCKMLAVLELKLPLFNGVQVDCRKICYGLEAIDCLCLLPDGIREVGGGGASVG